MSGPNLSQYFANDPPSMFDTLVTNSVNGMFIFLLNEKQIKKI